MKLDVTADSITVSRIPYRHSRVGSIRYVVLLSGCLASLAVVLLIAGAIMTALIFTEVRPPTADENYNRYLGSDWRSVIGPLMMGMAAVMIIMGCALTVMGYRSADMDRRLIAREQAELERWEETGTKDLLFEETPNFRQFLEDTNVGTPKANLETDTRNGRKEIPSLIQA